MSGAELIGAERQRQIEKEGWTPEHDATHRNGELSIAAVGYAELASCQFSKVITCKPSEMEPHPKWPWASRWWKPSDDPVRNLVKAGALIAAEIDRLQRSADQKGEA